jgi:glycosyltransferase involved in cell wall biosynthesis
LVGGIDDAQRRAAARFSNVAVDGRVDDETFRRALRTSAIALLPFADWCRGGGSRLKLIQAALSGLAVVATPATLEGFGGGEWIDVARTPVDLAIELKRLAASPEERARRGEALRAFARIEHDWLTHARRLAELYDRALH